MRVISIHSVPRSGSTWLLSLFNSNKSKICFQPLFSYKFKDFLNINSTKEQYNKFITELSNTADSFINMTNDFHKNNKKYFIQPNNPENLIMKHVRYHNLTEKLILLDPNIKIIGLIRSPYSVISSQMSANKEKLIDWKNGTDKNKNKDEEYFGINKWNAFNNDIKLLKKKYPKNVLIIKYENLYNDLECEMKKLATFCNINYEKDLNHTLIKKTSDIINSENYDYSIFNRPKTVSQIKSGLDQGIIDYIKNLPIDY